jgi:hypothetical protein
VSIRSFISLIFLSMLSIVCKFRVRADRLIISAFAGAALAVLSVQASAQPKLDVVGQQEETATPTALGKPLLTATPASSSVSEGQQFSITWSVKNAVSAWYSCTASAGGYVESGELPLAAGQGTGTKAFTALAGWAGKPSTCVWSAEDSNVQTASTTFTLTTIPLPKDDAALYSQLEPISGMKPGQSNSYWLMITNTGNTTWIPGTHRLGAIGDQIFGATRLELTTSVPPGERAYFEDAERRCRLVWHANPGYANCCCRLK